MVQALAQQQLCWVRGDAAGGNHVETLADVVVLDDFVECGLAREVVGHAFRLVVLGVDSERALADVEVDDQHVLACLCETCGKVARHEGLARRGAEAAERDDLQLVGLHAHEVHVGAHDAEGLARQVAAVVEHHDALFVLARLAYDSFREIVLGNLTDERHRGHVFYVLAALHAGVEEKEAHQGDEGDADGDGHVLRHHRFENGRDGRFDAVGGLQDARVRLCRREAQCILFALVEKVEVQLFLDVLLALDGEHLALLTGDLRDACGCLVGTVGHVLYLRVDVRVVVVY